MRNSRCVDEVDDTDCPEWPGPPMATITRARSHHPPARTARAPRRWTAGIPAPGRRESRGVTRPSPIAARRQQSTGRQRWHIDRRFLRRWHEIVHVAQCRLRASTRSTGTAISTACDTTRVDAASGSSKLGTSDPTTSTPGSPRTGRTGRSVPISFSRNVGRCGIRSSRRRADRFRRAQPFESGTLSAWHRPRGHELLNALTVGISGVHGALRIHHDAVDPVEFPRPEALPAPGRDQLAILQ